MNRLAPLCLTVVLAALPFAPAAAQSAGMQGMDMKMEKGATASSSSAKRHQATGVVKSTDPAKGAVTIQHGPVSSLNWPAMTMTFGAADRKLLQNLKPGAKVEFEFFQQGSRYVITSIK